MVEGCDMRAVVLERQGEIKVRDIEVEECLGPDDLRIRPVAVGICGSDVHYYTHGNIGDFVVREPMILGHEASGVITEVGLNVKNFAVGDRVCMEPGVPNLKSGETLSGKYNLDPAVKFWATPPVHGCLRETLVHPAGFTFKVPDGMSFHEAALAEPVAIGVYSTDKAKVSSGDTALVIGAGTIGIVTALAANAGGCSRVYIADVKAEKLDFVSKHYGDKIIPINLNNQTIASVLDVKDPGGVNVVFEASGSEQALEGIAGHLSAGGTIVLIGMPSSPVFLDVVALQIKEVSIETIFRYVNTFPKVVNLISSGKLNVAPLVTRCFDFDHALEAFDYVASAPEGDVKIMIDMK